MKQISFKFMVAGLMAVFVNTSNAFADAWCHAFLEATDGTVLQIDYQVRRVGLNHSR
jgi:hypothetical protein